MLDFSELKELLDAHRDALSVPVHPFEIAGQRFEFGTRRYLVGVINLSVDSWYKESVCRTPEEAIARGRALWAAGARIIDIGAESTLPHAARLDARQQLDLLLPVVRALADDGILVSVESYRPEVLLRTAEAGARVFNLTGMREADEVFSLAARFEAGVILCYVQGENVREVGELDLREDMVPQLEAYFRDLTDRAQHRGVSRCFVDPGLGFYYKNLEDGALRVRYQTRTFLHAFRLRRLGFPTFNILPHAPECFGDSGRRDAEPYFAVLAAMGGTDVIRTHEVERVRRVLDALELGAGARP